MNIFGAFLLAAGPVALGIRALVEGVRRALDPSSKAPSFLWPVLAIVFALLYSFIGKVNLLPSIVINGNSPHASADVGYALTGLAIAGVSLFWATGLANWQASTKSKAGVSNSGGFSDPLVPQK